MLPNRLFKSQRPINGCKQSTECVRRARTHIRIFIKIQFSNK